MREIGQKQSVTKSPKPVAAPFDLTHQASPILQMQRTVGNQAVQQFLAASLSRGKEFGKIQPKLSISEPGDVYEQEADRVADTVMRMPGPATNMPAGVTPVFPHAVQRTCHNCEEEHLHRKHSGPASLEAGAEVESEIANLNGGKPLSLAERAFFEPRFGQDFSSVRLHTDARAARLADNVSAHAFTLGNKVVFNSGQYSPDTDKGRHLLAHELTHVVQQGHAQRKHDNDIPASDEEFGAAVDLPSPVLIQRQQLRNTLIGAGAGALVGGGIGALVGGPVGALVGAGIGGLIGAGIGALTGSSAPDCSRPLSMNKVTSTAFVGGKTMDSYYPDLTGRGYYDHPGTAGPFDTGTRAGANAQLYGVIPASCTPGTFSLAQTVTYRSKVINGVHDPREGVVQDDIAKSGRDASRAPFRQEWAGGGGYIISMADPPSIGYGPGDNIEHDRDFVTSLVGPGGRASVNWSTSIRVAGGVVTRNTIS